MAAPASTATSRAEPPHCGIPIPTLIGAALVGALMWLAAYWIARAVWAALTFDPSIMEL